MPCSYLERNKIELFDKKVKSIANQIWLSPSELKEQIKEWFEGILGIRYQEIIISGETDNITCYIVLLDKNVIVFSPFQDLRSNVLLQRYNSDWHQGIDEPIPWYTFAYNDKLLRLLKMPTMLLINLCVIDNFPIPRLNLSIGTLSSYLRKQQVAQVHILDMQMGITIDEIVKKALELQPDLIGMSVNFGQKLLAFSLLDKLFAAKKAKELDSLIIAGNVIPSFNPEQFFNKYPELLICNKEGEYALRDLSLHIRGRKALKDVNGISYLNSETGKVVHNQAITVNMNEVPTPALDTLKDVAKYRGALTLEASRGCDYSRCTFCPRDHKLRSWRPLSSRNLLKQIDDLIRSGNELGIKPHIYLADEEFIGELPDGREAERVIQFCEGILQRPDKIRFDLAARADSVYIPKNSVEWNVERLKMWHYCAQAGTDRVIIGVESGSEAQLKRYGKGTRPEQNIIALRLLSALGIQLRIGFIMFDQLMEGFDDIRENLAFLERTDALMKPVDIGDMSYEELYDRLLHDEDFINEHKTGQPVYSIVSYMLASMEVLTNTPYSRMVKLTERKKNVSLIQNEGNPDTNMGRYTIHFLDYRVGELSLASQMWIDSNFGIMYTIKSLYKVANPVEKQKYYDYMRRHREISQYLLEYLVYTLEPTSQEENSLRKFLRGEKLEDLLILEQGHIKELRSRIQDSLSKWQQLMANLINDIQNDLINKKLTDSLDDRLSRSIDLWLQNQGKWSLINNPELI
ncbi:B12-binding domain-containing radical SAM protein [Shimazuella kribbensis]|uniref:B12-binding domain-containing radical SAM protein n=1 Tax=Shimazuella kribbensis TaxID=139808 RepID=UPI00041418B6|nr:B12-binding domain-containing radical SAM protein [Shimazuella kribbensis]